MGNQVLPAPASQVTSPDHPEEPILPAPVPEVALQYFAGLKLISVKDVIQLKKELQQLLTDLEYLSVKGEFNNGNKLPIYLSNINFETTYSYISKKNFEVSLFSIYSLNSMDSQNPHICRMQKKWIQSLKRHSTQISESGETQRIAFLEKQKNIIAAL